MLFYNIEQFRITLLPPKTSQFGRVDHRGALPPCPDCANSTRLVEKFGARFDEQAGRAPPGLGHSESRFSDFGKFRVTTNKVTGQLLQVSPK